MTFLPVVGGIFEIASKSRYLRAMALPGVGVAVGTVVGLSGVAVAAYSQAKMFQSVDFPGWKQRYHEARIRRNQGLMIAGAGVVVFASSLIVMSQPQLLMAFTAASWFGAAVKSVRVALPVLGVVAGSVMTWMGIRDLASEALSRTGTEFSDDYFCGQPKRERLVRGGVLSSVGLTITNIGLIAVALL